MDLRDEIEDEGLKGWCPTRLEMACIASLPQQRNHGGRERERESVLRGEEEGGAS